ncbi:hypothetical protein CKA34_10840 [Rhizobium sp. 11515TR]|nr:hypothetical protein CKA34_10840 [Rhizobium sp. 11515TR]
MPRHAVIKAAMRAPTKDCKHNTVSAWRRTSEDANKLKFLERVAGIEPAYSAWKAIGTFNLFYSAVSLCFCSVHLPQKL